MRQTAKAFLTACAFFAAGLFAGGAESSDFDQALFSVFRWPAEFQPPASPLPVRRPKKPPLHKSWGNPELPAQPPRSNCEALACPGFIILGVGF
ncbi:conserved exported hypothetical protein [Methylocella tundrae]|nr:conserved exported hypothetical protein [Methylocella tundrae]